MKLDVAVREFLIEIGETNENKYARCLQHGISGLREMNMDFAGVPTTVVLDVQSTDTVNLPSDFVNYMKIGAIDQFGNIGSLGFNPNISLQSKFDSCGTPAANVTTQGGSYSTVNGYGAGALGFNGWEKYSDNWRNGEMVGRMFGLGGGNALNGSYRVDKSRGVIVLENVTQTQIIMEYLSDLTLVDGQYDVHPFLVEALKAYIHWKLIARNLRIGLGDKGQARTDYFNEYRRSLMRFNGHSVEEWTQWLRKGNKLAPKF